MQPGSEEKSEQTVKMQGSIHKMQSETSRSAFAPALPTGLPSRRQQVLLTLNQESEAKCRLHDTKIRVVGCFALVPWEGDDSCWHRNSRLYTTQSLNNRPLR